MRLLVPTLLLILAMPATAEELPSAFPLTPGSHWQYSTLGDDEELTISYRVEARFQEEGDGEYRYRCSITNHREGMGQEVGEFQLVVVEGQLRLRSESSPLFDSRYSPPIPLLPARLAVGERWEWEGQELVKERGGMHVTPISASFEVEALERVEVPAGTFEAYRIREARKTGEGAYQRIRWFVPEVGMVKEEIVTDGAMPVGMALKEYTPGSEPAVEPPQKD